MFPLEDEIKLRFPRLGKKIRDLRKILKLRELDPIPENRFYKKDENGKILTDLKGVPG